MRIKIDCPLFVLNNANLYRTASVIDKMVPGLSDPVLGNIAAGMLGGLSAAYEVGYNDALEPSQN